MINHQEDPQAARNHDRQDDRNDRRSCPRFRVGLAVNVHVAWRSDPVTVEMIDIGRAGVRFRSPTGALRLHQEAAFGFVIPAPAHRQAVCVANGRVVRLGDNDEFVLSVERANDAFHGFVVSLAVLTVEVAPRPSGASGQTGVAVALVRTVAVAVGAGFLSTVGAPYL